MDARVVLVALLAPLAASSCSTEPLREEVPGAIAAEAPYAGTCAHNPCATGTKLSASCDGCVAQICASDPYCCRTGWDKQCVGEVASICGQSCTHPPDMSAPPDLASGGGGSGGGGGGGGQRLRFAVFGDCRPPNLDATSNYPSAIIGGVFKLAQQHGAQFVVGTGDYMFASTSSAVSAQVKLFQQARANYAGPVYLTMGNHECNGFTASNCPQLNETPNVQAFMAQLAPSGATKPYYRIDVPTPLGAAKFVFVAANAWDATQQAWLQQQLASPTAYTFVIRHEPAADTSAPGVSPSESLIKQAAYTLELNGHTHEYRRVDTKHVISGNAGAPLTAGSYGLLIIDQGTDGNITVTAIDEATGQAVDTWTVTPSGQGA
jgi:Calcineurin-like phosphoesterase